MSKKSARIGKRGVLKGRNPFGNWVLLVYLGGLLAGGVLLLHSLKTTNENPAAENPAPTPLLSETDPYSSLPFPLQEELSRLGIRENDIEVSRGTEEGGGAIPCWVAVDERADLNLLYNKLKRRADLEGWELGEKAFRRREKSLTLSLEAWLNPRLGYHLHFRKPISRRAPAKVAIIIDDIGSNITLLQSLLTVEHPLTLSIIPNLPYSDEAARLGHRKGWEIMLHLPMEPDNYPQTDPGEEAILSSMSQSEVERVIEENVRSIPYLKGMNNHMGSRITRDRGAISRVLTSAHKYRLFFIDSRTSEDSIAYEVARDMEIPSAVRTIFLDEVAEVSHSEKQLLRLGELAQLNGYAIGIGHIYPSTIEALKRTLPLLDKKGVKLVFASEVVQ